MVSNLPRQFLEIVGEQTVQSCESFLDVAQQENPAFVERFRVHFETIGVLEPRPSTPAPVDDTTSTSARQTTKKAVLRSSRRAILFCTQHIPTNMSRDDVCCVDRTSQQEGSDVQLRSERSQRSRESAQAARFVSLLERMQLHRRVTGLPTCCLG